jgi:DNA-binding GntR family transcriptional regulator
MTTERFDDADVQEGSGFATIADGVAATLRSEILTGKLLPAQRLRFEDMRAKYRVGVGTLREALLLLSGDSLVQAFKQRGFRVAPASIADLIDIFENLKLIEIDALRRSVTAGNDEWEAQLLAAHHRMVRCEKRQAMQGSAELDREWERYHLAFHEALIAACGSPRLLRICVQLREQALRYRHLAKVPPAQHPTLTADHLPLMEAALARDVGAACAILLRHFDVTERVIVEGFAGKSISKKRAR